MRRLRVVVVDDEELARRGLKLLLNRIGGVEIVAECRNGREAIDALRRLRPAVVFLDVQMPGTGGFDVIKQLGTEAPPHVVFVTAHDRYAVQAFEVHALDYLLKPVDEERVRLAVARAREALADDRHAELSERVEALLGSLERPRDSVGADRFVVRSAGRVRFVKAGEIDWVEAQGDYVGLHVGRHCFLLRETIAAMERKLLPRSFARIHRSSIVNLERVAELRALDNGEYQVVLRDGTELKLSRSYRPSLERLVDGSL